MACPCSRSRHAPAVVSKIAAPRAALGRGDGGLWRWGLGREDPSNEDMAKSNAAMAKQNFSATLNKIVDRYNVENQSSSDMTPGQVKNLIGRRSRVMENKLRGENIEIPESLKNFTFAPYLASTVFPNPREISMIMEQLEIMGQEILPQFHR